MDLPEGSRVQILAPMVRGKKGEHQKIFENAKKSGYVRVRVDGIIYDLSETIELEKQKKHYIEMDAFSKKRIYPDELVVGNTYTINYEEKQNIILYIGQ